MEAKADVGQLIYTVKERNRYLSALKEIDSIVSSIDDANNAEREFHLISDLCKRAIASPRKINCEVNKSMLSVTSR